MSDYSDDGHYSESDNFSNRSEAQFDASLNSSLQEQLDMIGEAKSEDEKEEEMQFPLKKVEFMEDPADMEEEDAKSEEPDGYDGYEQFENMGEQPFEYDPDIPREQENTQRGGVQLKGQDRISSQMLNKYEYCHIISLRALQIEQGAPLYLKRQEIPPSISSIELAEMELRQKKTPIKLRREHSNNDYEFWSLDELCLDIFFSKTNMEHFKYERESIYKPPAYFKK